MLWRRLSLTTKMFIAIALTSAIIVAVMAGMVALNMRAGFSHYLLQAEINRFDGLVQALSQAHKPGQSGWPELVGHPRKWHRFVGRNFRPGRRRLAPGTTGIRPDLQRPNRPRRDPLQLAARISLLNANRDLLAGRRLQGRNFIDRPITAPHAAQNAPPLGWLRLAEPLGARRSADSVFLSGQLQSLMLAALLAVLLSALTAWLLARQFLAPVRQLAKGAQTLAAGNFSARIPNGRHDELGALIEHYNSLAESLEAADKAERQWITDTSHELQTPLAVMRAEIEALQDGVREPDRKTFANLHDSVMRLSHLVGDLNALARTREGKLSLSLVKTDLNAIIRDAIDHHEPAINKAGLKLTSDLSGSLQICCDKLRIRQLVDNILENSRRYTTAPGKINVLTHAADHTVTLTIEDSAPSPPPDSLAQIFDRFYRVEPSRSRKHGGSGLGLAICKAITKAHGGKIYAAGSTNGGLKITVQLPVRAEDLSDA